MSDDIVTRLRQRAIYRFNPIAKAVGLGMDDFIETEAADEIERLRSELDFWRTAINSYMADE